MSRRLSMLASFILLLFVVVAAQSAYVQYFRASALERVAPESSRQLGVELRGPRSDPGRGRDDPGGLTAGRGLGQDLSNVSTPSAP